MLASVHSLKTPLFKTPNYFKELFKCLTRFPSSSPISSAGVTIDLELSVQLTVWPGAIFIDLPIDLCEAAGVIGRDHWSGCKWLLL